MRRWRVDDSAELYNINGWGMKYFSINEHGHVAVTPREGHASVDLKEIMDQLLVKDITAPVLLRFFAFSPWRGGRGRGIVVMSLRHVMLPRNKQLINV